jgi:hypothetical protein
MLLDCFTSCMRCLTPRRVKNAADTGESAPIVPDAVPEQVAPEAALDSPQVPAANGLEPPFQTDLCFCTIMGKVEVLRVTIDQSMSVNVVTNKCLARLGFKPLQHAMPFELREFASQAFPGHYGWQNLCFLLPQATGASLSTSTSSSSAMTIIVICCLAASSSSSHSSRD